MTLRELLGKKLKDDDVVESLELHDMSVVYDFDRTHENIEDAYWAAARTEGFQCRFDQNQILHVVFCYVRPAEGFSPITPGEIGAPIHASFAEAEQACQNGGHRYSKSDSAQGSRYHQRWIRIESPGLNIHYEYWEGLLSLITLSLPES